MPRAVFTLQKEVVERLAAEPGDARLRPAHGAAGAALRRGAVLHAAGAHLFHPPPKVDSAVVRLTPAKAPRAEVSDEARFRKVVKAGFAQRRKTLLNSLKSDAALVEAEHVRRRRSRRRASTAMRRAETLSVEEFAALERALKAR